MAIDLKELDSLMLEKAKKEIETLKEYYLKLNPMSTPMPTSQITWNGTPIPEKWYSILYEYTAKYSMKIKIEILSLSSAYLFNLQGGGPTIEFVITKEVAVEDVKCMVLAQQLDAAVKSMGLEASKWQGVYTTAADVAKWLDFKHAPGIADFKPKMYTASYPKSSDKLNSLYEMYNMVDPKPNKFCAKHRPTVAQFLAKVEAEEMKAEAAKTLKTMSPDWGKAIIGAFGQKAIDYLSSPNPLLSPAKVGNFAGNYYTDYGKQLEAKAAGTQAMEQSMSKKAFKAAKKAEEAKFMANWKAQNSGGQIPYIDHKYKPMDDFPDEVYPKCATCNDNNWECCCPNCKPTTKYLKGITK